MSTTEPYLQVEPGPIRDLLYQYDVVVREMSTWDHPAIVGWVRRIEEARDKFRAARGAGERQ